MPANTKLILSLDGGGLRGVFSAAVVAHMEATAERPAGQVFDVILGTSTGSVIAAMLAIGTPAEKLGQLYREVGFKDLQHKTPEARTAALENTLRTHLGKDRTFSDISGIKLAIPFRDTLSGEVVFASNFLDDADDWEDFPLWQAVRRSTALWPLFTPEDDRYLDGGYSAYANPSYAALRAAREEGWLKPGDPGALQIHSIGTTYHAPLAGKLGLVKGIEKYIKPRHEKLSESELIQVFINDAMLQDVNFLQHQLLKAARDRGELVYRRYNVKLESGSLGEYRKKFEKAGIPTDDSSLIKTYRILDDATSMQHLATIGGIVAKSKVEDDDFRALADAE